MASFGRWGAMAATAFVGSWLALHPARADDPAFITGAVGLFDVLDNEEATSFNVEYRSGLKLAFLKPFGGAMVTTDRATYGYGGFLVDIYFGRRLVLTGNTAVGLWANGHGKKLGSFVEFRSGLELAFRFDNRSRLGVGFHHISNAGLGHSNPGTEILSLIYSIPLGGGN